MGPKSMEFDETNRKTLRFSAKVLKKVHEFEKNLTILSKMTQNTMKFMKISRFFSQTHWNPDHKWLVLLQFLMDSVEFL